MLPFFLRSVVSEGVKGRGIYALPQEILIAAFVVLVARCIQKCKDQVYVNTTRLRVDSLLSGSSDIFVSAEILCYAIASPRRILCRLRFCFVSRNVSCFSEKLIRRFNSLRCSSKLVNLFELPSVAQGHHYVLRINRGEN